MLSLKGQQPESSRLLKVRVYHVRVDEVYLVKLVLFKLFKDELGYLTRSVQSGILRCIEELAVNRRFFAAVDTALVVHSSHLSHDKEVAVVKVGCLVKLLIGIFKYVMIVASAQSLIARNYDISLFTLILGDIRTSVEIELTGMGSMLQNAFDSGLELVEVGLCTLQ